MFTGLVEMTGKILARKLQGEAGKLTIETASPFKSLEQGDSIAVNGICLTVTDFDAKSFTADVSSETFRVTNLKNLKNGDLVNLERAMLANGRFGGHIVSGHIDGCAKLVKVNKNNEFYDFEFELNSNDSKYVIKKGSITINGISLTIAGVNNNTINIAVIPHTYENTNLKILKMGEIVNIEVDMIAKYVEKFLLSSDNKSRISLEFLQEHGF